MYHVSFKMAMAMKLFLFCLLFLLDSVVCVSLSKPQQIHIALGRTINQISVTWSTREDTEDSIVIYSLNEDLSNENIAYGGSELFLDASKTNLQYLHNAVLTGLLPGRKYYYICGTKGEWSEGIFSFTTLKAGTDWSPRFVFYGDLGFVNDKSVPRLEKDIQAGMYDVALHVGDFAYNLDSFYGATGDRFFNLLQPVAANIPYMTCPGNHENANNFTQYKRRFFMPGDERGDRMYYSFNVGPVHIISFDTEYFFFINEGILQIPKMFEWLQNDLVEANKPENRALRPWIITMAHRPMYCSNNDRDDCTDHESIVRVGVPGLHILGLEKLFNDYGVDLELWAHEHSYERLWPVYNRGVYNGSDKYPYTNPGAPVHIITGSAGCQENISPFDKDKPFWSAKRVADYGYTRMQAFNTTHLYLEQVSDDKGCQEHFDPFDRDRPFWSAKRVLDYGYTRMTVFNSTHLYTEQISDDKDGKIMDTMWLIKEKHGSYPPHKSFQVRGNK